MLDVAICVITFQPWLLPPKLQEEHPRPLFGISGSLSSRTQFLEPTIKKIKIKRHFQFTKQG
jgi:hypothetical protein